MTKRKKPFGIYIGRFQPLHWGHLDSMIKALEVVDKLIVIVGSSFAARDPKNPFTFEERKHMITEALQNQGFTNNQFVIIGVRDYYYNENAWVEAIRREVKSVTKGVSPVLFGHKKDSSSYYLMSFPDWDFRSLPEYIHNGVCLSATDIRNHMYSIVKSLDYMQSVIPYATDFIFDFMETDTYFALRDWHKYNTQYPEELKKYPVNVVAADSVVFKSGHVLVIRRGKGNGTGLIALPGGHLNLDEEPLQGAIRELREETGLKLMDSLLLAAHREEKVFAYPQRSQRARVISIAEHFDLGTGSLLDVEGGDDAAEAFWIAIEDVMMHPEWFFEDHWHIIFYFYNKH